MKETLKETLFFFSFLGSGNATIGLEILEDLPEVNTVVAPFGGGGLSCGIAAAMAAKGRKDVTIFACEVRVLHNQSEKEKKELIDMCSWGLTQWW